ncbi:CLUMA_CG010327, isoform A [Clunio marinus]|uniref:CLUMA_CG010327, isoform A n=1 Tax=Clunio marinus TaxID=568069 RepID=A0A1J1IEU5_9DIPT|nr:CLUMA_CG010327, isoform A [Clunio marinus]
MYYDSNSAAKKICTIVVAFVYGLQAYINVTSGEGCARTFCERKKNVKEIKSVAKNIFTVLEESEDLNANAISCDFATNTRLLFIIIITTFAFLANLKSCENDSTMIDEVTVGAGQMVIPDINMNTLDMRQQPNRRIKKRKDCAQQKQSMRVQFELRLQSVNLCATRSITTMPPIARHLITLYDVADHLTRIVSKCDEKSRFFEQYQLACVLFSSLLRIISTPTRQLHGDEMQENDDCELKRNQNTFVECGNKYEKEAKTQQINKLLFNFYKQ